MMRNILYNIIIPHFAPKVKVTVLFYAILKKRKDFHVLTSKSIVLCYFGQEEKKFFIFFKKRVDKQKRMCYNNARRDTEA